MVKKRYLALIGIILFLLILTQLDLNKILNIILRADFFYILVSLILVMFIVVMKGLKWRQVIKAHNGSFPLLDSIKVFCIGFFVSLLTPGRVGEFLKAFYLKKEMPLAAGISTVLVDRLIDIAILLALGSGSIIAFAYLFEIVVIPIEILLIIILAFLVAIFFILKEKYIKLIARPLFKMLVPEKFKEKFALNFHLFYSSLKETKNNKGKLFAAIIVGLVSWIVAIVFAYFIALSLSIEVPFYFMILVLPIIALVDLIPISISSIGTRDITLIFLFSFYSISAESAVAFSLLYLFQGYILVALIGAIFFIRNPIDFNPFKQVE